MESLAVEPYKWEEVGSCGSIPPISNISAKERFSGVPLHSRALMPKRDVKKDNGRKLNL
jgi:hypothetical protein